MKSTKELPKYMLKNFYIDFLDLIADDKVENIEAVLSKLSLIGKNVSNTQTIITVDPRKLISKIPKYFVEENKDYLLKIIKKIEFYVFKNPEFLSLNIIILRVSIDESYDIKTYGNVIQNFSVGISTFIYNLGGFSNLLYKNEKTCPFLIKSYFIIDPSTLNQFVESASTFNETQHKDSGLYQTILSLEPPKIFSNNDALCSYIILGTGSEMHIIRTLFANSASQITQLSITNIIDNENLIHENSVVLPFQKEFLLDQIIFDDGFISFLILLKIWSGYVNKKIGDVIADINRLSLNNQNLKELDNIQKTLYWMYNKNIFIENKYSNFLDSLSSGKGYFTSEIAINNPKFNYLFTSIKEIYKLNAPLLATLSKIIIQDIGNATADLNNLKEFSNSLKNTTLIEENRALTFSILVLTAIIAISSVVTAILPMIPSNNLEKSFFTIVSVVLIGVVVILAFLKWEKLIRYKK